MDYTEEEEHLKHAESPEGRDAIIADMQSHFTSGGIADQGDLNVIKHSTDPDAAPRDPADTSTELAQELQGMAERHENEGDIFVRGVAGLEFAYAEEDADAE